MQRLDLRLFIVDITYRWIWYIRKQVLYSYLKKK